MANFQDCRQCYNKIACEEKLTDHSTQIRFLTHALSTIWRASCGTAVSGSHYLLITMLHTEMDNLHALLEFHA